jgi:hypothetical protein
MTDGERLGLEAAIRAAKLALFVVDRIGGMPNDSWRAGFARDLATAEATLAESPTADETAKGRARRVKEWVDGGGSTWGVPMQDIEALAAAVLK